MGGVLTALAVAALVVFAFGVICSIMADWLDGGSDEGPD